MKQFTYTVSDPLGIHARPAGLLAKEAKKFFFRLHDHEGRTDQEADTADDADVHGRKAGGYGDRYRRGRR